jgi:hypothetical protein
VLPDLQSQVQARRYQDDLVQAGLSEPRVLDITRETWQRFFRHSREYFRVKRLFQQIDEAQQYRIFQALPGGRMVVEAYFLILAQRPCLV